MKVTVSRHVFGSIRGYTTLAKSPDLSHVETVELEILSFGQSNESSYLDSLQIHPAYISRPLQSGRWAVTRVFQGKPDDYDRTTLLFVSAIITMDDWLYSLKCDVDELLECPSLWQWDGKEKLEAVEVTIEGAREGVAPETRDKALALLAAVEKYGPAKNTTIVVKASDFDVKVLRLLNMVLPSYWKQTFSCAVRALDDGLPFALISMAKEGSFGNSKRRIINWTPASTVDDCPYTESVAQFWQSGRQAPWQFIDSCKSFLIELASEPELGPRERPAKRRAPSAGVKEPGVTRRTHLKPKLAIVLLMSAALVFLSALIIIGRKNVKLNREVVRAENEGNAFLQGYDLDKGFRFPAEKDKRERLTKQGEELSQKAQRLYNGTNDPALKTLYRGLDIWLNSAKDADKRYDDLEKLFAKVGQLKLNVPPSYYPDPNIIKKVEDLRGSIDDANTANLEESCILQIAQIRQDANDWYVKINELLSEKKQEIAKLVESGPSTTPPNNYSEEGYGQHEEFIKELEKKLQEFNDDESLTNAKKSPIGADLNMVEEVFQELNDAIEDHNGILTTMGNFRSDAEASFEDANNILAEPNITDCTVDAVSKLEKGRDRLDNASKLWPRIPKLDKVQQKLTGSLRELVEKAKGEIEEMAKQVTLKRADVRRINELREILKKVEKISEESDIKKGIKSLLEKLKELEEKAKSLRSDFDSERGENEQIKSSGW